MDANAEKLANFKSNKAISAFAYVYYSACFLGCMLQVKEISVIFFSFETLTGLSIEIPDVIDAPDLSICFRYVDIMDIPRLLKEKNRTLECDGSRFSSQCIREIQGMVTISDIFDYTPDNSSLFKECRFRVPMSYSHTKHRGLECYKSFSTSTFYLQEFICYRFYLLAAENSTYNYRNVAYAMAHPGMIFSVDLDIDTFKTADYVKVIVHSKEVTPFRSAALAPSFSRNYDNATGLAEFNLFLLSYSLLMSERLPAPYTTNCIDYTKLGFVSSKDCVKRCLTNYTVKHFAKIPFSTIVTTPYKLRHINNNDIGNATLSRLLLKYENFCMTKCKNDDCLEQYAITRNSPEPQDDKISFVVNCPRDPSYTIKFHPKLNMTEYIIYILSLFGTWFGVSVLSLNPFQTQWLSSGSDPRPSEPSVNGVYVPPATEIETKTKNVNGKDCAFCVYCCNTRSLLRQEMGAEVSSIAGWLSMDKIGLRSGAAVSRKLPGSSAGIPRPLTPKYDTFKL